MGGTGGRESGSNGGGKSTWGRRRGGGRRDIQSGWEPGEMGKISQHWHNILQQEKHTGAGTATEGGGNRGCRMQEAGFRPSCPPPPPPPPNTLTHILGHCCVSNALGKWKKCPDWLIQFLLFTHANGCTMTWAHADVTRCVIKQMVNGDSYTSFVLSQPPACNHNSEVHAEPFTICQESELLGAYRSHD